MTSGNGPDGSPGFVRPARPADAERVARIQVETWRGAYGTVLPASVLAELDVDNAIEAWSAAIELPPTRRHHVLVAVDPDDLVVGFAALTPAGDDDSDVEHDSEVAVLLVDEAHAHRGHGSRLLAACVDIMRSEGCVHAIAWLLAQDDASRGLLTASGWAPDGSHRTLEGDGGEPLRQLRLHTDLSQS